MVGTMIELPRAAVCADQLAAEAEFFSFGTNDLTQTALGISRDDAANFMHAYQEAEIYETDPFVSIDVDGVGQLVQIGADKGRSVRGDIKLGICGNTAAIRNQSLFARRWSWIMSPVPPFRTLPVWPLHRHQQIINWLSGNLA